jgi:hypothetical protein
VSLNYEEESRRAARRASSLSASPPAPLSPTLRGPSALLDETVLAFGSPASLDLSGGIENVIQETGELGEIAQPIL